MYDRVAGKGGTYPRRYHVSLHHKDHSEGKTISLCANSVSVVFFSPLVATVRHVTLTSANLFPALLKVGERFRGFVALRGTFLLWCLHDGRSTAARRVLAAGSWSTPRADYVPRIALSPINVSGGLVLTDLLTKGFHRFLRLKLLNQTFSRMLKT